jgi:hypothetical protein
MGIGFSSIGKLRKSWQSHFASTMTLSNDVSSDSIVDLVKMVC